MRRRLYRNVKKSGDVSGSMHPALEEYARASYDVVLNDAYRHDLDDLAETAEQALLELPEYELCPWMALISLTKVHNLCLDPSYKRTALHEIVVAEDRDCILQCEDVLDIYERFGFLN